MTTAKSTPKNSKPTDAVSIIAQAAIAKQNANGVSPVDVLKFIRDEAGKVGIRWFFSVTGKDFLNPETLLVQITPMVVFDGAIAAEHDSKILLTIHPGALNSGAVQVIANAIFTANYFGLLPEYEELLTASTAEPAAPVETAMPSKTPALKPAPEFGNDEPVNVRKEDISVVASVSPDGIPILIDPYDVPESQATSEDLSSALASTITKAIDAATNAQQLGVLFSKNEAAFEFLSDLAPKIMDDLKASMNARADELEKPSAPATEQPRRRSRRRSA